MIGLDFYVIMNEKFEVKRINIMELLFCVFDIKLVNLLYFLNIEGNIVDC